MNGDEAALQEVIQKGAWSPVEYFGHLHPEATWSFESLEHDGFLVKKKGQEITQVSWDVLANVAGRHNQMNALAAIAAAEHVGISPQDSAKALGTFKNVKRRLELVGQVNQISVYDDFAHHPTAIATTIDGLRRRIGSQRLLAVLEPRSNTMKLGVMKQQLPDSLAQADFVFAYGAKEGKSVLGWNLQEAMNPMGQRAKTFDQLDALVQAVREVAMPGDHILVMSNGGFGGVHQQLLKALA